MEENDLSASAQPYVNLKVDANNDGSIDTTLTYDHTPIPLNAWTAVDTQDGSATGASGWLCTSTEVVGCPGPGTRITWAQMVGLLPGAVFRDSLGFPRSLILATGQSLLAFRDTVRGALDQVAWSLGNAETVNDFEPAQISAADVAVREPTRIPITRHSR